ncbi:MAG: type II toxin-antitoxin system VapC family toxin [Bacteroidota bacterium]
MKYLLDTHTLLWWHTGDRALSKAARSVLEDPDHEVYLSAASIWEIQIKTQLGRLPLPVTVPELVHEETDSNGFLPLLITYDHIYELESLGTHHRDPFDRLLVAQARYEGLTLITDDRLVRKYNVPTMW